MSSSPYVSGHREFQPKELRVVGERICQICEGSLVSEIWILYTVKVLSVWTSSV